MLAEIDTREAPPDLSLLQDGVRAAFPELPRPLVREWSEDPTLLLDRGRPWLVTPAERDPHRRDGRAVMPRSEIRRMAALAGRDMPARRLAIAHELDVDHGPVRAVLPHLGAEPRACTDEIARLLTGPVPPHPALRRSVQVLELLLGVAARAAGAALDPILFAVVAPVDPVPGAVCLWYPISVWRW